MSAIGPPRCRLCGKEHWQRDGCANWPKNAKIVCTFRNTSREGRRVLKAEAERPDATRIASTERPDPLPPPRGSGNQTHAEKVRPGKPRTATKKKAKRKAKA